MAHTRWIKALLKSSTDFLPSLIPTLRRFGEAALELAVLEGIHIKIIGPDEGYADQSPHIHEVYRQIDCWPHPPAGLFVVEERTVYLRSLSPMTVAHEFSHALDCALGKGIYLTNYSRELRQAFTTATGWITPYAATRIDEYFAESMRGYLEINDPTSPWPAVSRRRLAELDPQIYAYLDGLFLEGFGQALATLRTYVAQRRQRL